MCCTLMGIAVAPDELQLTHEGNKPPGEHCQFCDLGVGCTRYEDRPKNCQEFECMWLQSQRDPKKAMPPDFRPDRLKAMFVASPGEEEEDGTITIHVPAYLKRQKPWNTSMKLRRIIQVWDHLGFAVFVVCGDTRRAVTRRSAQMVFEAARNK